MPWTKEPLKFSDWNVSFYSQANIIKKKADPHKTCELKSKIKPAFKWKDDSARINRVLLASDFCSITINARTPIQH